MKYFVCVKPALFVFAPFKTYVFESVLVWISVTSYPYKTTAYIYIDILIKYDFINDIGIDYSVFFGLPSSAYKLPACASVSAYYISLIASYHTVKSSHALHLVL